MLLSSLHAQQMFYQMSDGGLPWSHKFSQFDNEIPIVDMGPINVQALQAEDLLNDQYKDRPWRFGYNHYVNYNINNSGVWKILENGDRVWRLGITCPGAITINLAFQYLSIPQGGKLFVFNEDKTIILGAFTQQYVSDDLLLGTELIPGETIFVEYFVPASSPNNGSLEISTITHGYRETLDFVNRAFGSSGSCNMNVNCPDGAPWVNQRNSTVMLVSGSNGFCTGALINNSCNNGIPYVLTANHCGSSGFGSWIFRFNWQAAGCPNPPSSPSFNSISGGTQRASRAAADMSLVEINGGSTTITNIATYGGYYAGWNRSNTPPPSAVCVHHPSGDIKKISFDDAALSTVTAMGGEANCCWQVEWDRNTTTEPGSSGSPLFDNNGRIIGQLWGGGASCTNLSAPDYYGRVYQNWNAAGPTNQQLAYWLDPAGCSTGAMFIDGYDPNAPSLTYDGQIQSITTPTGTICSGTTTPVIVIRNNGTTTLTSMTINYQVDGGAAIPFAWTGSLATSATANVTMPAITVGAGAHTYTVTIVTNSLNGSNTDLNTSNNSSTSNFNAVTATSSALPIAEGFTPATFPPATPAAWTTANSTSGSITWARTTAAFYTGPASAWLNYYADNTGAGSTDDLILPYLNFSAGATPAYVAFNVAYRRYGTGYDDSLRVLVSTNCGASWTTVYSRGGTTLASVSGTQTGSSFTPSGTAQWRRDSVSLNPYVGLNNVLIKFQGYSAYGQNIWLDNININAAVATPPTSSFNISDNNICVGEQTTLTNTSSGATSFTWSMPSATPNSGTTSPINISYAAPGVYTVTLTATNAAGSNTSTQTITVNANPTANATNTGPYCAGSTIQLNSVGGSATDDWTGPNSYSQNNVQNPTIASSTTAMSGIYTVTVTNGFGCSATSTTSVTVNANPTANATNTGPYCVGSTIQLNSVGGSSTDDWSGPSYVQNNTQNPTIASATLGNAGVYTVTVTNASGCTSTSTTTVVVNANPTANATNTGPYCSGTTIQLNSVGGSATDDWAGPGGYSQLNVQNPTIASSTTTMAGIYTVTVTNASGCTSTSTTTVVVNATPTPTASNTGPYCPGNSINLSSTTGGTGTDFDWTGPNSYVQNNTQNPIIASAIPANDGVYTVTVTSSAGCSTTTTTTVIVVNTGSATAGNSGPYCDGENIDLTSLAGGTGYAWTGPLTFSSGSQNPTITSGTTAMSGVYTVTITFVGGCSSSATTSVTVNSNPAAPVITPGGPTTFCEGGSVTLTSSYGSGNVWNTSATSPSINVNSSGIYTVTYTDANGCTNTASQSVTVNSLPSVTQTPFGIVCVTYSAITLSGGSPAGGTYSGTAVSAGQFDPGAAGTGTFPITYTYTDGNGCTNSDVENIVVSPCVGMEDEENSNINIFPNPTTQFINVTGLTNGEHQFTIINNLGQIVHYGQLNGDGMIDLGMVATGSYYLKIDNQFWKIIKK